jgi:hypothetical protein
MIGSISNGRKNKKHRVKSLIENQGNKISIIEWLLSEQLHIFIWIFGNLATNCIFLCPSFKAPFPIQPVPIS